MSFMKMEYKKFKEGYITDTYNWHYKLKQYAVGTLPPRAYVMGRGGDEVIYCPIYWQAKHWVGLVINTNT